MIFLQVLYEDARSRTKEVSHPQIYMQTSGVRPNQSAHYMKPHPHMLLAPGSTSSNHQSSSAATILPQAQKRPRYSLEYYLRYHEQVIPRFTFLLDLHLRHVGAYPPRTTALRKSRRRASRSTTTPRRPWPPSPLRPSTAAPAPITAATPAPLIPLRTPRRRPRPRWTASRCTSRRASAPRRS